MQKSNLAYKKEPQNMKFRPYFNVMHTNSNLYHYAGNNPVHYIDPTGMFNFETNTIEEGDTLSKIADDYNSKNGTNVTADDLAKANNIDNPNKIYSGDSLDFSSFMKTSKENILDSNISKNADCGYYNKTGNFLIGLGELVSGVGIIVGGGFTAASLAPETVGASAMVGYSAVLTGGAISAYGISRMAGENNVPIGNDLKNIILPPMAAFADINSQEMKK